MSGSRTLAIPTSCILELADFNRQHLGRPHLPVETLHYSPQLPADLVSDEQHSDTPCLQVGFDLLPECFWETPPSPQVRPARPTLGAARPWITAGCATAQWKARFARRYPPPFDLLRRSKSKPA
jgi:hypothetical protein